MKPQFRCILHGSLRKHLREMGSAFNIFQRAGIEVVAPSMDDIVKEEDGFLFFRGEERSDPRLVELLYLQQLRQLGRFGFSYFVNPDGYIGKSVSYELGIAQASNVPCYFLHKPVDHPAYIGRNAVWSPESLAEYIVKHRTLPSLSQGEGQLERLWKQVIVPSSIVTAGAIIEYAPRRGEHEVLMVRTHKWRDRFSIVGGKVRRHERVHDGLLREVKEETGLDVEIISLRIQGITTPQYSTCLLITLCGLPRSRLY
ncbi:MAG: hypothetical protein UY72_C0045G0002 [Candidatus Uhrbacteria bacterium GW2011_GWD2_52_7]|uniref:Nudix hydrolase domain-containing protein n=1 Tax=Candidatus Uhrbacteria bacterium GW2011_GWD2_52_7 TaxID=1618989 RepID=A0A0G1XEM9_9BACT|nr:MAG: hypothetical protein UY72_C0045G0002 [Candidatus Uhrbacteria bacterium GW2011_GWD2_52_7]